jgi:site-specific recombinase XerD
MPPAKLGQRTISETAQIFHLETWIDAFLVDRKAQNLSKGTVKFYSEKLRYFTVFCDGQALTDILQIDAVTIREFLLWLEKAGHNPGGIHACFRSLKVFMRWWELEVEPDGWKNPIRKVKAPKVAIEPLAPVELEQAQALINCCEKGTFTGTRDAALFTFLLDTGARAAEVLALNLSDIDDITGAVLIRHGKGKKPRTVYMGKATRKAWRAYLKQRTDKNPAAWVSADGEPLKYGALRGVITRRSKTAGIPVMLPHAWRRAFAINMLRAGVDVYSLQKLMGHSDLQILRRYLAQTEGDTKAAHDKGSPADRLKGR